MDKNRYPDKILVDGSLSTMKRLPGDEWVRVRIYPTGRAVWTWNNDPRTGGKNDIVGRVDGDDFIPRSQHDVKAIYDHFTRINAPGQDCMEPA